MESLLVAIPTSSSQMQTDDDEDVLSQVRRVWRQVSRNEWQHTPMFSTTEVEKNNTNCVLLKWRHCSGGYVLFFPLPSVVRERQ